MNREDIIRMAREARLTDPDLGDWVTDYGDAEDAIMKFATLVAAAECEALAAEAEKNGNSILAMQIRARGQA